MIIVDRVVIPSFQREAGFLYPVHPINFFFFCKMVENNPSGGALPLMDNMDLPPIEELFYDDYSKRCFNCSTTGKSMAKHFFLRANEQKPMCAECLKGEATRYDRRLKEQWRKHVVYQLKSKKKKGERKKRAEIQCLEYYSEWKKETMALWASQERVGQEWFMVAPGLGKKAGKKALKVAKKRKVRGAKKKKKKKEKHVRGHNNCTTD